MTALGSLASAAKVPRAQLLRELLDDYLRAQEPLPAEQRSCHVATLLRHPLPRRHPLGGAQGIRLRLATTPETAAKCIALGLVLPGQHRRAHEDFVARPLADAVMVALATRQSFTDDLLQGLPPLITQGAAVALWRLAAAATTTGAERVVYDAAAHAETELAISSGADVESLQEVIAVAAELRSGVVAWHDPWRLLVVRHLTRRLLTGSSAGHNLSLLDMQAPAWGRLRDNLQDQGLDHPLLRGVQAPLTEVEGRGGTAVWRAQRVVAGTKLLGKLADRAAEHVVRPPGWRLQVPSDWIPHQLPPEAYGSPRTGVDLREAIARGDVLLLKGAHGPWCGRFVRRPAGQNTYPASRCSAAPPTTRCNCWRCCLSLPA